MSLVVNVCQREGLRIGIRRISGGARACYVNISLLR